MTVSLCNHDNYSNVAKRKWRLFFVLFVLCIPDIDTAIISGILAKTRMLLWYNVGGVFVTRMVADATDIVSYLFVM